MTTAVWKYTFPIEKAEQRADGHRYLVGLASGPGVDLQNHEVDPLAIHDFVAQIAARLEAGDPIPYRDAHRKDGVFMDLGILTKGWVTPANELAVEVQLDDEGDNAGADWLFKQVQKGKKFGMSIAGSVPEGGFIDELRAGVGIVRRFTKVVLSEISNTTRPIWTPSFGTVLSKAIDEAQAESAHSEGDEPMSEALQTAEAETPTPSDDDAPLTATADEEAPDAPAEEAPAEETVEDPAAAPVDDVDAAIPAEVAEAAAGDESVAAAVEEEEVEKAGARISRASNAKVTSAALAFLTALKEAGFQLPAEDNEDDTASAEKSVSDEPEENPVAETVVEKSADALRIEALETQVAEMNRELVELRSSNSSKRPALISKSEGTAEKSLTEQLAEITDPAERLKFAFRHRG